MQILTVRARWGICRSKFPFSPTKFIPFYGGAEFHDNHHYVGKQWQSNFALVFSFCDYIYGTDKVCYLLNLDTYHQMWCSERRESWSRNVWLHLASVGFQNVFLLRKLWTILFTHSSASDCWFFFFDWKCWIFCWLPGPISSFRSTNQTVRRWFVNVVIPVLVMFLSEHYTHSNDVCMN